MSRLAWLETTATMDGGTMLRAEPEGAETVSVYLREMTDGRWVLCFVVGVSADTTLPEVEDFARRCADLLEAEPVDPAELLGG